MNRRSFKERLSEFKGRYRTTYRLLAALLVIMIIFGIIFGIWAIVHAAGGTRVAPTLEIFTNPGKVWAELSAPAPSEPESSPAPAASEPPATEPEIDEDLDDEEPETGSPEEGEAVFVYEEPAETIYVTAPPTEAPTVAPAHATFTGGGNQIKVALLDKDGKPVKKNGKQVKQKTSEIRFQIDGKDWVYLLTFEYHGGYFATDDPYFLADRNVVDDGAYGPSIQGKTLQERIYNWLRELCKSPHQIIRLWTQMGLIKPTSIFEENQLAYELATKSADKYDEIVNETLVAVYKKLYGGNVLTGYDWDLENYMTLSEGPDETSVLEVHGRVNSDKAGSKEQKHLLFTPFADDAEHTFVSAKQGYLNTANDAENISGKFSTRAWICLDQGGTWKWRKSGSGGGTTITTAPPTATPAPTSTPKPTPTKEPSQHPTQTDFPIGYGGTQPQNSENPLTTEAPQTSTPAPAVTAPPTATVAPTEVPTPSTRPTEICSPAGGPLTTAEPPETSDPGHNVPGQGSSIGGDNNATGDFDVNAQ